MWERATIKRMAKERLHFNYWKMVLAGLILSLAIGSGVSIGSGSFSDGFSAGYDEAADDNLDTFDVYDGNYGGYDEDIDIDPDMLVGTSIFSGIFAGVLTTVFLVILFGGLLLSIFVLNPLAVGGYRFFYQNIRNKADLRELGRGFDTSYGNVIKTLFLRDLYQLLWTLLFIIPGIVKGYEYRMIPYLLAENPQMDAKEAFSVSKRMMDGNKWAAFVFDLSFVGWGILNVLTFGILGIFYVYPYQQQANAMLYDAILFDDRNRQNAKSANAWENGTTM